MLNNFLYKKKRKYFFELNHCMTASKKLTALVMHY